MDEATTIKMCKESMRACAEKMLRTIQYCETLEEMNACVQSCRQELQSDAYLIGLKINENKG